MFFNNLTNKWIHLSDAAKIPTYVATQLMVIYVDYQVITILDCSTSMARNRLSNSDVIPVIFNSSMHIVGYKTRSYLLFRQWRSVNQNERELNPRSTDVPSACQVGVNFICIRYYTKDRNFEVDQVGKKKSLSQTTYSFYVSNT